MYDYIVTKIGFTLLGVEYNVSDRVTGAAARALETEAEKPEDDVQHLMARVVRVAAQKPTPPAAAPAPSTSSAAPDKG